MKRALVMVVMMMGTARAQDAKDAKARAEQLFDEGTAHYNLAEYAQAVDSYKEAYRVDPEPLFLFNIGQAYRQEADCVQASTFYRSYLRVAPGAYNKAKVEKFLAEMDECGGVITEVEKEVRTGQERSEPELSMSTSTSASAIPEVPEARIEDAQVAIMERPRTLPKLGMIGVGIGVIAAAVGARYSWHARQDASAVEQRCGGGCDGMDVMVLDGEGKAVGRDANIAYAIGGVAIAVGAYLWGHHEGIW